jgi:ferric-dicitrate binding protein FerR (iron transport regulator)
MGAGIFNTIRIPIGKQYRLVLQDGTTVWLNAVSQLRYPVQFTGATREVELEGAGYFEVKSDVQHPFKVHTPRGVITVTGTHFVVSDYATDQAMITGLEEGKVKVETNNQSRNLTPGEVVEVSNTEKVILSATPLSEVLAWKEQKLWFHNASYEEIFNTLVRWYPIEVMFETKISSRFSGVLPTNRPLQELLKILEKAGGVHFSLEGRQLKITE